MTDTNAAASLPKFKKLVTLLRELFQFDQPDLDFGIYRIMHAKAGEMLSTSAIAGLSVSYGIA